MKIAYFFHSSNGASAADRRRLVGFASRSGTPLYRFGRKMAGMDLVVLTVKGPLASVAELKRRNGRVILDLVDSYWLDDSIFRNRGRSLLRKLEGNGGRPLEDFRDRLKRAIGEADRIVCASKEQALWLRQFSSDVVVITDTMSELGELRQSDPSLLTPGRLRILWEGLPENTVYLEQLRGVLAELRDLDVELTLVTNPTRYRFAGRFLPYRVEEFASSLPCKTAVLSWSIEALVASSSTHHVAIIPLSERVPMAWAKPGNKLLSFWWMGLRTLTSPTPSYLSLMDDAGVEDCCWSEGEWLNRLREIASAQRSNQSCRNDLAQFARCRSSSEATDHLWNDALTNWQA